MPELSQAFQAAPGSLAAYRNAPQPGDNTPTDAKLAQLQPRFADHLQDLIQDQGADGNPVGIASGYRDPAQQTALYQAALAKYGSPAVARLWVAPPGQSNHNAGLAADLTYASPQGMAAVRSAAPDYGLNFPLGNENWHIEPQGIRGPAAKPAPAAPLAAMASLAPPPVHAAAQANLTPASAASAPPSAAPAPPSAAPAPPSAAPAPPSAASAPAALAAPAAPPQSNPYASLAAALGQAQAQTQIATQPIPQAVGVKQNFAQPMRDPSALARSLTQGLAGNLTLSS